MKKWKEPQKNRRLFAGYLPNSKYLEPEQLSNEQNQDNHDRRVWKV